MRIGLLQFGVSPPKGSLLADLEVEPVLSFHSRLALVKNLPAGSTLSYGREHTLKKDSTIGVIAAGYGDAIPPALRGQSGCPYRWKALPHFGQSDHGSDPGRSILCRR